MNKYKTNSVAEKYIITSQKQRIYTVKISIDGYYNEIQIDCPKIYGTVKSSKKYHKTMQKIHRYISKILK